MDEADSTLDNNYLKVMMDVIDYNRKEKTIIIITHLKKNLNNYDSVY